MGIILNRRRVMGGGGSLPYDDRFVDLGLPSGTLWAKGNIIKDGDGNYDIGEPTDGGCYFSWGNIDGHNAGDGYDFSSETYVNTPGYSLSLIGNISPTDAQHDAAFANIGNCHIPTEDDWNELFHNTDEAPGGIYMKKSDHSVFITLPRVGFATGTNVNAIGNGYYYSSSESGYTLVTYSGAEYRSGMNRYMGCSIRPVK